MFIYEFLYVIQYDPIVNVREQIERELLSCILHSWISSLWMSYIFPVCVFMSVCVFFDVLYYGGLRGEALIRIQIYVY